MTIQSYSYLIASSVASGLVAFNYSLPEQAITNEIPAAQSNQECVAISINPPMSAFCVQPEFILDWQFPARLVSAAIR
ncbi:hypothetical protein [Nostoc sp. FACHB-110]|uniref:hypothetical protein n=1 Tax=Nostoc sp. FACHB-110 TaxID=2692834 RepID=UPI001683E2E9|nr:hypothetical protein [Nostoc sp. FACHB-110]MBD2436783.1 hypothetical protein [Nostoc sp. FACHB-110]